MKPLPPCDREDWSRGDGPPFAKCGQPADAWLSHQKYPGNRCREHWREYQELTSWPREATRWQVTHAVREVVYRYRCFFSQEA